MIAVVDAAHHWHRAHVLAHHALDTLDISLVLGKHF
jgi:hypothetical protein